MSGRDFKCVVVSGKSCTHLDGKEGECACYSYDHAYEQEPCDGENPILEIAGYAATSGYSRRMLSARRSARCASRSATLSVACFVYVYRHSLGTCPWWVAAVCCCEIDWERLTGLARARCEREGARC